MALKLLKKPKLLSEFIEICKRNEYFAAKTSNNLITNIKFRKHSLNLQANIERQWLFKSKDIENSLKTYSNVDFTDCGENLTLHDKYMIVRKRDRLARATPFGLIEILNQNMRFTAANETEENLIGFHFDGDERYLTCSYLVTEKQSREYFYRIQRLRKIWWMKYAAHPGRFTISETKHNEDNDTTLVSIKANYPFGNVEIEKIELLPLGLHQPNGESSNKATAPSKLIKTTTTAEVANIETVFDAIDAGDFGEMCLHRKLAPYQITIFIICKDMSKLNDLEELGKYVKMLLERSNIIVFNLSNHIFDKNSTLESKYNEMDAIGVPYGLILDEESLIAGLMKLRNRDTTLFETIHISHLKDYVPKIFQS